MRQYRFVGNAPCIIGGTEHERFGSIAQFDRALAEIVLTGGGCFIPEPDFQALDVTEVELMQFAYAGGFPEPSVEFVAKRARAQARAIELMADPSQLDAFHGDTTQEVSNNV